MANLVDIEVVEFGFVESCWAQFADSSTAFEMFGRDGAEIACKRLDGSEPLVACARRTFALFGKPVEKAEDLGGVEERFIEPVDGNATMLGRMSEKQLQAVAVGEDGVATRVALES